MALDQTRIGRTVAMMMEAIEDAHPDGEGVSVHSSVHIVLLDEPDGQTDVRFRASEGTPILTAMAMITTVLQMLVLMERGEREGLEQVLREHGLMAGEEEGSDP